MNLFDKLYLSVFHQVKQYKPRLAARFARLYVSIFQVALCLLFGIFFLKFSRQMKLNVMDSKSLWIVSVGIIGFIFFKNWMSYNGKKRNILMSRNTKGPKPYSSYTLIVFLLALYLLSFILSKAV
jgi:hypothetical protein